MFTLSHARDKTKNIFLFSFTELKAYSPSRHIYKTLLILVRMHSMQDARHMNFVIDLVHREVCFSVVEHRSAESKGLRFVSSWRLRIFSISHARDKTANIFLYFFTEIKTYSPSYSIYMQFFLFLAPFFQFDIVNIHLYWSLILKLITVEKRQ